MKTKKTPSKGIQKNETAGSLARRISVQTTTWVRTKRVPMMIVSLMVPAATARILPQVNGYTFIDSASFAGESCVQHRINGWTKSRTLYSGCKIPPAKGCLKEILMEKLDTPISVPIQAEDWPRIEAVTTALGITPCDWLLACAQYNARLEREKKAKESAIA